jgi:hypothetical protein
LFTCTLPPPVCIRSRPSERASKQTTPHSPNGNRPLPVEPSRYTAFRRRHPTSSWPPPLPTPPPLGAARLPPAPFLSRLSEPARI